MAYILTRNLIENSTKPANLKHVDASVLHGVFFKQPIVFHQVSDTFKCICFSRRCSFTLHDFCSRIRSEHLTLHHWQLLTLGYDVQDGLNRRFTTDAGVQADVELRNEYVQQ